MGCDLAVDGTYLYYVARLEEGFGGTPARVPKVGGRRELLNPAAIWADDFLLDGPGFFYVDLVTADVRYAEIHGGPTRLIGRGPKDVAPFPGSADELRAGGDNLFWNEVDELCVVSKRGGSTRKLLGVTPRAVFDVVDRFVYWQSGSQIVRTGSDGDIKAFFESTRLTKLGGHSPVALIADGDTVYWAERDSVWRAATSGKGGERRLATFSKGFVSQPGDQRGLAIDATSVYVIAGVVEGRGARAEVVRTSVLGAPKGGGEPVVVADAPKACGIVADEHAVYVATGDGYRRTDALGAVLRVDKTP
jgi:hypothetical protein